MPKNKEKFINIVFPFYNVTGCNKGSYPHTAVEE